MNLNLVEQIRREHLHHVVPDVNSHVLSCANGYEKNGFNGQCKQTFKQSVESCENGSEEYLPDNTGKVWDVLI